ncbi:MAG: hypothetical protein U0R64_05865 [Candidatus Nanopelagicales bacterium]
MTSHSDLGPAHATFMAAADAIADERPGVDLDMAREVFAEAAQLLHNGLALDGLDDHDTRVVVDSLSIDLVAPDPGGAIRARAQQATAGPAGLHDPEAVAVAYLNAVNVLQL